MSLRKIGLASNTFDNILQMTVDCLFGGVDIAIFQSLDDLCMLGQSIVDASLQRVVDGFEGITFIPKSLPLTEYPEERETLCIGAFGKDESFFTLKGMAETVADVLHLTFTYERTEKPFLHPYRTAAILCEGEVVGYLGQVKYEIMKEEAMREDAYVLEINMKALEKWYGKAPVFEPLPKFAEEKRDLALVMNKDITCGQVEECIYQACSFVKDVTLFDVYEGKNLEPGKKSYAVSFLLQDESQTLNDKMIDKIMSKLVKNLEDKLGAKLR